MKQEGVSFFKAVIIFVDLNPTIQKKEKKKTLTLGQQQCWSSSTDTHSGSPPRFSTSTGSPRI